MNFEDCFARVIGNEGGLSMDPRDRGNWTGGAQGRGELRGTKYGISAAAHPDLDIAAVTLDQARAIYRRDYWAPAGCEVVPDGLRFALFDFAVNSGPKTAAKLLQRAVHEVEDGMVGPRTLLAIGNIPIDRALRRLDAHRLLHFADDTNWPAYGRGWAKRVANNALADGS